MRARAALARNADWREALDEALAQVAAGSERGTTFDLALLFASAQYASMFTDLIAKAQDALRARVLIGCSGQGIIGTSTEVEGEAALSLLAVSLPGATLTPLHLRQSELEGLSSAEATQRIAGAAPDDVRAGLLFADPFTLDTERLLHVLSEAYPAVPMVGGMASGDPTARRTFLFLNGRVHADGAVAVALGGPVEVRTVVSQGARPIGRPWTITGVRGQIIESIGGRPALEVLVETLRGLPANLQERARANLLVGLAMDEYLDEFGRGDFLIRNLIGIDHESGAIAVGALPREGQTLQFQLRDAEAADEDLRFLLEAQKMTLGGQQSMAALLCSCNGRGVGLFGAPHHDARMLAEILGPIPVAGCFCNGEIGPVGLRNFLHGFTASMALIVPGYAQRGEE